MLYALRNFLKWSGEVLFYQEEIEEVVEIAFLEVQITISGE